MAGTNGRSAEQIRREIDSERARLTHAVEELRGELNVGDKLRGKLPVVAAAALGAGFVVAGGIGATMRLLARRGREGHERAKLGKFSVVEKD
jgi:hypothetical protein